DDMTAIVIATLPERAMDTYPDAVMRAALASTFIRVKLTGDEMRAVLPYRLGDLGGFRLLRVTPNGNAVFTLGPHHTTLPLEQPYIAIVLHAASAPPGPERDRLAQLALTRFMNSPGNRITSSEQMRVGGEQGHQILAESEDPRTKDPLITVQWLRFGPSGV